MAISHDLTFHTAPGTTDGAVMGRNSTSKDSFFGGTPVAQPTLAATGATADQIVAALAALNLVKTS
jgi:hypothetical protein